MALIWKLLMTTKEIGGLILPKIRLYYWASQLRTVVEMKRLVLLNRTPGMPGILISTVQCLSQQSQRKFNVIHGLNKHCRYGDIKKWQIYYTALITLTYKKMDTYHHCLP